MTRAITQGKSAMNSGISPLSLFPRRCKRVGFFSWDKDSGISPDNILLDESRNLRLFK